ncbi:MAG: signal peptidase I [Candidatus Faecousia sp.]|nr:signal peptidase I [Clostridiales bacterium]MDY6179557.1 signal peptidase I [Candidatus Faecousia sp.]
MKERKKPNDKEKKLTWQENLVLYLHDLVIYVSMILLAFLLLFRVIVVDGDSMFSTLWDGDYLLLVSNLLYPNPDAGDIVVVSKQSFDDGKPIVKRVIATEGQIVDIDFENGIVYVDGLPIQEDYVNTPTNRQEGMSFPIIVDKGCYFVMGDNRNNSRDSRSPDIGQIDRREILGKAIFLMIPGTDGGLRTRDFGRIGAIG